MYVANLIQGDLALACMWRIYCLQGDLALACMWRIYDRAKPVGTEEGVSTRKYVMNALGRQGQVGSQK